MLLGLCSTENSIFCLAVLLSLLHSLLFRTVLAELRQEVDTI